MIVLESKKRIPNTNIGLSISLPKSSKAADTVSRETVRFVALICQMLFESGATISQIYDPLFTPVVAGQAKKCQVKGGPYLLQLLLSKEEAEELEKDEPAERYFRSMAKLLVVEKSPIRGNRLTWQQQSLISESDALLFVGEDEQIRIEADLAVRENLPCYLIGSGVPFAQYLLSGTSTLPKKCGITTEQFVDLAASDDLVGEVPFLFSYITRNPLLTSAEVKKKPSLRTLDELRGIANTTDFSTLSTREASLKLKVELIENGVGTQALHETVVAYRANRRAGTHSTKTKATVAGSGKKPWRQKGTGNARAGYKSSPVWRGGGAVFGPHPRDYSKKTNKSVKQLALRKAISSRINAGEVYLINPINLSRPKTKDLVAKFHGHLEENTKALIVTEEADQNLYLASRNHPQLFTVTGDQINAEDVLLYDKIFITDGALNKISTRLQK
jgi:large subunit ribosomal protein L4